MKNILGIITARGGSKSIPNKNIISLAGKPLLAYTCEAALNSQCLSRVILNTDDSDIADIGRMQGVDVPFMRPFELAQDDTLHIDVLNHTLMWMQENEFYCPDVIVLLQPTSPLRRAEHIDGAVELLLQKDADTVVSVVEVPHQYNPYSIMRLEEEHVVPYIEGPMVLRRQDKLQFYARNGPAVLVVRREVIEGGQLYGESVCPYIMRECDSIDIDIMSDVALAEFWLARRSGEETR